MSKRIEEAIRNIMFTRKQQDVLLEQIIKKSLITETTIKAKITGISKSEWAKAQAAGAVYAYGVVTRNVTLSNLPKSVAAVTRQSGLSRDDDPTNDATELKTKNIGETSEYATSTSEFSYDPTDKNSAHTVGTYTYFIGNIKETGKRTRCVVWIIPMKLWEPYEQTVLKKEEDYVEIFTTEGEYLAKIGRARIITMKNFIKYSHDRANTPSIDREWYIKNNESEIPLPPASWYEFADETPAVAISIGRQDVAPAVDNVQDKIIDVVDKKLSDGDTFTGTWNDTKGYPIEGKIVNIKITNNTKTIWIYFVVNGEVDTNNEKASATMYDASKKVIGFYEGTMDKDVKPYTGITYTDDTKTTKNGTYDKGTWTGQ